MMNITQREKTLEYIFNNLLTEDLHFLKYEEFLSKSDSVIRRFSSSSLENLDIKKIREYVEDDKIILISLKKEA